MTGVANTQANLLTQFPLPVGAGQFGAQQIQNVIASVYPIFFNPKNYGAFGNGSAHPASGVYGSLAALQAVYGTTVGGVTIALTNELDWLAHQKCIDLAVAAGGGLLGSAPGTYIFSNANSVSDGSGTLLFPNTQQATDSTPVNSVSWAGCGRENTVMVWPSDLGTGRFAVNTTGRLGTNPNSFGFWRDLGFIGPNASVAVGVKPANMHCLGWSPYRVIDRLNVVGFNAGICISNGQQTKITDITFWNNYYSIYYDLPNIGNSAGDMEFDRITSNLSKMAFIGIGPAVGIYSTLFLKCIGATTPFFIYKETGGADNTIMQDVTMINCQAELIGNAVISDGLAAGSHVGIMSGFNHYELFEWVANTTYYLAAKPRTGVFCMAQNLGELYISVATEPAWAFAATLTSGIFEIDHPGNITLRGDLDDIFNNLIAAAVPFGKGDFRGFFGGGGPVRLVATGPTAGGGWDGNVFQANGNPTLLVGDVVAGDSGGGYGIGLSAGNTTEMILGIVKLPNIATNGPVAVARSGYVDRVNAAANVIAAGAWARAGASGHAITSTGLFQTTSKNLGVWGNTSGTTPNFIGSLYLQGII